MAWTRREAIIACLMLSGCEQPVPPPASATLVRAMAVQVTNFDSSGSLTGEIQARYESDLGFRIAGKVVERPVDIGASVMRGQLLAPHGQSGPAERPQIRPVGLDGGASGAGADPNPGRAGQPWLVHAVAEPGS
jgi:hypothetical protein